MSKHIPLSVPNLKGREKEYVLNALDKEWVSTGGVYIDRFEDELAKYLGVEGAVACQSGTAGIHLALILSGVGIEHEVIVPTLTFIAAVNPVKYVGAAPVFMDCDDSLTMDVQKLECFCREQCTLIDDKLINNKSQKEIKAIIVVHVFGNIANMIEIMNVANKYNLKVIEDATEALGSKFIEGKYQGLYAGTIGDYGVYSFNGNKIITTGGGGMIVSKNKESLAKAKYLSTQAKDNSLYYIHNTIGYNYRMTNLQAAVGLAQLEQLPNFIDIKRNNYIYYRKGLEAINGLDLLDFNKDTDPNYWFYSLIIDKDVYILNRDEIIKELSNRGVESRPIWGLVHNQKPYIDCESYNIEKANYYLERVINIPCSTNLKEEDIDFVLDLLVN